ncbi:MAG: DUF2330 domain-containing protein, partial [Myxococcota bacterium]|nr:DUF2330 domain-containing protein [Myxococcota bacterium]
DAQQVVFETDGDTVSVEYLVTFDGSAETFGWVIPIPGEFVELDEGDVDRFTTLRTWSEPQVHREYASELGCGCAGGDKAISGDGGYWDTAGVSEIESGTAGPIDYSVLEATSTESLLGWLDDNGWDVGQSEDALNSYVSDGGFQFVALMVDTAAVIGSDSGVQDTGGWAEPDAVAARIVYEGTDMRYPARLSSASSAAEQRTTVYVIGDQRATVSGWAYEEVGDLIGDLDADADEMYTERLWEIGGTRAAYGLVHAGQWESHTWFTRFDTWAQSAVHEVDAVFALDGGEKAEVIQTEIYLYQSSREQAQAEARASSTWLLWLPLASLGWHRRRRAVR